MEATHNYIIGLLFSFKLGQILSTEAYFIVVFRQMFTRKDKDETGTLNAKELEECLQLCGLSPTKDDIAFLTSHFDRNGKIL
jgi:Ca2+-binding EF-hand superfamily protein